MSHPPPPPILQTEVSLNFQNLMPTCRKTLHQVPVHSRMQVQQTAGAGDLLGLGVRRIRYAKGNIKFLIESVGDGKLSLSRD